MMSVCKNYFILFQIVMSKTSVKDLSTCTWQLGRFSVIIVPIIIACLHRNVMTIRPHVPSFSSSYLVLFHFTEFFEIRIICSHSVANTAPKEVVSCQCPLCTMSKHDTGKI